MSVKISFKKTVDVTFGQTLSDILLEIKCRCGKTHTVTLDLSGHYSGTLPCDAVVDTDIQVDPQMWRQIIESRISMIRH